jgi:hypothetical protein
MKKGITKNMILQENQWLRRGRRAGSVVVAGLVENRSGIAADR